MDDKPFGHRVPPWRHVDVPLITSAMLAEQRRTYGFRERVRACERLMVEQHGRPAGWRCEYPEEHR